MDCDLFALNKNLEIMNDKQENKVSMFLVVDKVLTKFAADWAGNVAFAAAVAVFRALLGEIMTKVEVQETAYTGVTKDKKTARLAMKDSAMLVSGAVIAYASTVGNETLKKAVSFSASSIMQGRDTVAAQRARVIHDQANGVVALLADFGVTATVLSDYMDLIEAFEAMIPAPRVAIVMKKGAGQSLQLLIGNVLVVLKDQLDKLMPQFKVSAPEFYEAYFDARIIVDTGSAKPSVVISGIASDLSTGLALEGVDVKVTVGENPKVFKAVTLGNGLFKIGLSASVVGVGALVKVVASKEGYLDLVEGVTVEPGKDYVVDLAMKAV